MNRADLEAEIARLEGWQARLDAECQNLRSTIQSLIAAQISMCDAQRGLLESLSALTVPDYGGHD